MIITIKIESLSMQFSLEFKSTLNHNLFFILSQGNAEFSGKPFVCVAKEKRMEMQLAETKCERKCEWK